MIKRGQRRTLTAHPHIICSEVPNHGFSQFPGQSSPIPGLQRALLSRCMGQCLTMKPNQRYILKPGQQRHMGLCHQIGHGLNLWTGPKAQASAQHGLL